MDGSKPVFDMGLSTLSRVNYQLWKANEAKSQDNPNELFKALTIIFDEVYPFMDKSALEHNKKLEKKASEELIKHFSFLQSKQRPQGNMNVWPVLMEWRRVLQVELKKAGLLMREGEDSWSAMA